MDIVNFKNQKIVAGCKDFLKTGKISPELRASVYDLSPSEMDSLRSSEDENTRKILDIAIRAIKSQTESEITDIKKRINYVCQTTLDTLNTTSDEYKIPSVMTRYRESINPVKALYYDLQEILFLYEEKPKNKHHVNLIAMFRNEDVMRKFEQAIINDLARLDTCQQSINKLKATYKVTANNTNAIKVIDLQAEMSQWLKVLRQFYEFASTTESPASWTNRIKSMMTSKKDINQK